MFYDIGCESLLSIWKKKIHAFMESIIFNVMEYNSFQYVIWLDCT